MVSIYNIEVKVFTINFYSKINNLKQQDVLKCNQDTSLYILVEELLTLVGISFKHLPVS